MGGMKFVVGLMMVMIMVPETMQLRANDPLNSVVKMVEEAAGYKPLLGLVLTSKNYETALLGSGYFVPNEDIPVATKAGRKYKFGTFNNLPTVYVMAGEPLAGVSVTTQILIDYFKVKAVIGTGSAGSISEGLRIGDIAVLNATSYTGVWSWEAWQGEGVEKTEATLKFGDFNVPEAGDNKLASITLQPVSRYTTQSSGKTTFWFPVSDKFQKLGSELKGVKLEKCIEEICLVEEPKVVVGVKGGASDTYLKNQAYGNFLHKSLDISVVDTESAAIASTAYANGIPFAILRSATNKSGERATKLMRVLARQNAIKVAASFANLLNNKNYQYQNPLYLRMPI